MKLKADELCDFSAIFPVLSVFCGTLCFLLPRGGVSSVRHYSHTEIHSRLPHAKCVLPVSHAISVKNVICVEAQGRRIRGSCKMRLLEPYMCVNTFFPDVFFAKFGMFVIVLLWIKLNIEYPRNEMRMKKTCGTHFPMYHLLCPPVILLEVIKKTAFWSQYL